MSTRWARAQHGRRHVGTWRLVAGVIALAMVASACSSGTAAQDEPSESPGTGGPTEAATQAASGDDLLRVGVVELPKLLVPAGSTAAVEQSMVDQVYDGLVRVDQETGTLLEPALAASWAVSDDGLRYEFELRDDVVFHDGTPFDANAVQLNFERLTDPDSPYYWEVGATIAEVQFGKVAGLEVEGPHTVVFQLEQPDPDWLRGMADTVAHFVSPTAIENHAPDEVSQSPIGTGAFQVESRDASAITFTRNPEYWGPAPQLAGFVIRGYAQEAGRVSALEAGEVDLITEVSFASIEARDESRFKPFTYTAGTQIAYVVAFNTEHDVVGDPLVRQALNHAVNREAISEGLFAGVAEPSTQLFSSAHVGHDPAQEGYAYDPERAKELLAEAGYPDGVSIKAIVPTEGLTLIGPVSQAIQADLQAVGVSLEYDTLEWTSYLEQVGQGLSDEHAFYMSEWAYPRLSWLRLMFGTESLAPDGPNRGHYSNPEADRLMDDADAAGVEPEQRKRLYQEAQSLIVEDAPWLFLIHHPAAGMSVLGLDGITYAASGFDLSTVMLDSGR